MNNNDNGLVIVLACTGAGLGSLLVAVSPGANSEWVVFAAAAGSAVGIAIAWIEAGVHKLFRIRSRTFAYRNGGSRRFRNRRSSPTSATGTTTPRPSPPKPFRKRLANFTHQDESAVMTDDGEFQSKMPFWSAVHFLYRVPPKSADFIREVLVAIGRAVRGR